MKFRVERDQLADAVAWSARALPSRPAIPTLAGLFITSQGQDLVISGYDQEIAASTTIEAAIDEPGSLLVSGRLLTDIAKTLPGQPVVVATEGSRLEVQCGRAEFMLPTLPVEEYPTLPELAPIVGTLPGSAFATAVSQVAVAANKDDTTPMLLGVRLEIAGGSLTLAATDRYRLATRELTWQSKESIEAALLVPARQLAEAAKLLATASTVNIHYGDDEAGQGWIGFSGDGRSTNIRLISGDYPDYRKLFPTEVRTTAVVERADLAEAVKRVALVAERNTPVRLSFAGSELVLQAGSGDEAQASESLECTVDGESISIAFNPGYLLEGVAAIDTDRVSIAFVDANKQAVLSPENGGDYRYLLMPVRLSA